MDKNLGSTLRELDARFDATLAREEDEAAADLALSLQQDVALKITLGGKGWRMRLPEGSTQPVRSVGNDYAICGSRAEALVPLDRERSRGNGAP